MATSPPLPSPKSGTASPNDSLRRDASKKDGVKGWMGTLTRRKKTDEGNFANLGAYEVYITRNTFILVY